MKNKKDDKIVFVLDESKMPPEIYKKKEDRQDNSKQDKKV